MQHKSRNLILLIFCLLIAVFISFKISSNSLKNQHTEKETETFLNRLTSQNITVGNYVNTQLQLTFSSLQLKSAWQKITHFLDMSDWIKAALLTKNKLLYEYNSDSADKILFIHLADIKSVLSYFLSSTNKEPLNDYLKPSLQDKYGKMLFGWKHGKAPRLEIMEPTNNKIDPQTSAMIDTMHETQSFFKILDRQNNLYQQPAYTSHNAPIWVSQDHNWAYLFWKRAESSGTLPQSDPIEPDQKKTKTVLVHWDAHRDFSAMTDIDKKPAIKKWLEHVYAKNMNLDLAADAAGSMGIANYIVPALLEGLVDEVILVIPPHTEHTDWRSSDDYATQITLGISDDNQTIGYWGDDKVIQNCATGYCSKEEWLQSRPKYTRTIKVRFISSEKIAQNPFAIIDPNTSLILNFDIDIFGTYNVKKVPLLPNYDLNPEEYLKLLTALKSFYLKTKQNVKVISIAQSPNFARESESRKPLSDLLRIFTPENSALPAWAEIEKSNKGL